MKITEWPFCIGLVFCLLANLALYGQDDVQVSAFEDNPPGQSYYRNYDSTAVETRRYSEEKLARLKEDPELSYGYTQAPMSLWDAFWRWVDYHLRDLFHEGGGSPEWDRLFLFVLFVSALVYAIIRLLKFNTFRIFYGEKDKKPLEHAVEQEDIHEMDFEALMREATGSGNYRLAVRLLYLWALKLLADANHVTWEPGKTNLDYLAELDRTELKSGFRQLSYYFEYAWYGNFSITPELYQRVSGLFNTWKTTL
ncbi:MAG TPA: DUF4129 domain-containing protein [Cyclobacteriaceae bacterium]